jgi:hypothetical protein
MDEIKTEGFRHFREEFGGNLLTARMVSGIKAA